MFETCCVDWTINKCNMCNGYQIESHQMVGFLCLFEQFVSCVDGNDKCPIAASARFTNADWRRAKTLDVRKPKNLEVKSLAIQNPFQSKNDTILAKPFRFIVGAVNRCIVCTARNCLYFNGCGYLNKTLNRWDLCCAVSDLDQKVVQITK